MIDVVNSYLIISLSYILLTKSSSMSIIELLRAYFFDTYLGVIGLMTLAIVLKLGLEEYRNRSLRKE